MFSRFNIGQVLLLSVVVRFMLRRTRLIGRVTELIVGPLSSFTCDVDVTERTTLISTLQSSTCNVDLAENTTNQYTTELTSDTSVIIYLSSFTRCGSREENTTNQHTAELILDIWSSLTCDVGVSEWTTLISTQQSSFRT